MLAAISRLVAIGTLAVLTRVALGADASVDSSASPVAAADSLAGIDAPELVARVIKAYGGRAALDGVKAYRVEGRIVATMQGHEGPTVRLFGRPDRLRVEIRYSESPEIRILRGTHGWRGTGSSVQAASGPMLDAMVLQTARAGVPWILMDRTGDARRIAPIEHHGRQLTGLEIPIGEGLTLRVYVDPGTNRVVMSQGLLERGPMHTAFETVYDDWRSVDGVLFAFHEENYASGKHTGDTTIDKVQWNPKLHDDDFAPPTGKNRS